MAFVFKVDADVTPLTRWLTDVEKQIPFAMALALTKTAQAAQKAEVEEMKRVFDRPTPYTLKSTYIRPATKTKLQSSVYLKDRSATSKGGAASDYLLPQIVGGARQDKRFEYRLKQAGILPPGMQAVPGKGARINKYGNMTPSQITGILSALRAQGDPLQNRTTKKNKYFVSRGGVLPRGVWQRTSKGLRSALIFVNNTKYEKRFDFYGVASTIGTKEFRKQFDSALQDALERPI